MAKTPHPTSVRQLHAVIRGRVQGVSFRYYTSMEARRLGLMGWVANRPDGAVETVAEGSSESLNQFLAFLHTGPPSASVTQVEVTWNPSSGQFSGFGVRYL